MADPGHTLDFRIKIEERFQTGLQLLFDLILAAFEHVHGDVRVAAAFQLHGCITDFRDLVGGQEPHTVHQR